jgi:hypothetical protein
MERLRRQGAGGVRRETSDALGQGRFVNAAAAGISAPADGAKPMAESQWNVD